MMVSSPGVRIITPPPMPDFSQWGPVDRERVTSLQRKVAEHLSLGWQLCPHVTQLDRADITDLEAHRRQLRNKEEYIDVRLTITPFILKAIVSVLKAHPRLNASFDMESNELVLKRYYHIGVAVDTPHGLIVPAVRDVDHKSIVEIASELDDLIDRTRNRKVTLEELEGGTFTVTNLGGIGGEGFTPIIKYPEVAILGVSRGCEQLVRMNGEIVDRLFLPLCLSYDHRVVNGAEGARFLRELATRLEDPETLMGDQQA